ncbi:MAG: hypothetical protein ACT4QC_06395 [Planctomycetaceae bacterium]
MHLSYSRVLTWAGVLTLAAAGNTAHAQWFNPFCCCCCPPPVCVQPAYQTVPVTEYREVRQVVQKPIVETKYVEQPVTEYRQVVENKTAEVPTVSYQPVTEYHTVQRDCGRWATQWHYRPKMHPCQFDGRPDLFGFLNRTQYSVRMAFTPDYIPQRMYVPNVVAQQIPVTRQVAVRGTQTINYQVARVVPITTTRKVAVNTVRMVAEEVVTQRPVTVMKVVPFGSTLAYGAPLAAPSTTTALQPTTDTLAIRPKDTRKAAVAPKPAASQPTPRPLDDEEADFDKRESNNDEPTIPRKRTTLRVPGADDEPQTAAARSTGWKPTKNADSRPVGRWVARKSPEPVDGPELPDITIAQRGQVKL